MNFVEVSTGYEKRALYVPNEEMGQLYGLLMRAVDGCAGETESGTLKVDIEGNNVKLSSQGYWIGRRLVGADNVSLTPSKLVEFVEAIETETETHLRDLHKQGLCICEAEEGEIEADMQRYQTLFE